MIDITAREVKKEGKTIFLFSLSPSTLPSSLMFSPAISICYMPPPLLPPTEGALPPTTWYVGNLDLRYIIN